MLGSVCSIATVLVSVITTQEIPPSPEELAALRAKKGGVGAAVAEIWEAIVEMPGELRKLALVYLFQWYAMVCYWQYVSLSIAQSVFGVDAGRPGRTRTRSSWTGLVNGWYNIVTFLVAFPLVALAKKRGAKLVHISCLLCAAVGLLIFAAAQQQVPDVPADHRSRHRLGVDHGRALHHGRADDPVVALRRVHGDHQHDDRHPDADPDGHLRGDLQHRPRRQPVATRSASPAILLAVAAAAMMWIKEPPIVRDVDDVLEMPMGGGH